jgi:pSer/pThr/pTyr-binding forkhead associated (FHA) protein
MNARLVIVRGEGIPSSLDLDPDHPITLGRSRENTMVLPARHVSRHHAQVYFQGGHWFVRELHSHNGIRVNSVRVCGEARLLDDQEIAIADVRLHFRLLCGGRPPPPAPVLDPAERTPEVLLLARSLSEERRFEDLPVLGDALEEAGCTDADILSHCRGQGPHVCGCWVLDAILTKG